MKLVSCCSTFHARAKLPTTLTALTAFSILACAAVAFAGAPTSAPSPDDDMDSMPVKAPNVGTVVRRTPTGARGKDKFGLFLFSPGEAGATVREHPTVYWYLAQQSEDDTEVVVTEVTVAAPGAKPAPSTVLMRKLYTGRQPPGIYAATIDEASLQPKKLYQVSVVVHLSGDLGEVVNSIGYVVRNGDAGAAADLDDPAVCAKAGLWYDAIDAAMRRVAHGPQDSKPHKQLHALLRGQHVLYNPGPSDNAAATSSARQEESQLFHALDACHDALIMTKPPEKKPARHE